ncbi:hypothetical protein [Embleya sp. NPDC020630]|uniref:hypothetical protein n=1 Tax=Embleya sp. NPDC020630 TaxID=3363979 RepID=UPI0037BE0C56
MEGDRIRALYYAVTWVDQHTLIWAEDVFPASYEIGDWSLLLSSERRLVATPSMALSTDEAREELRPVLEAWSVSLELEHRMVVEFSYLGADVQRTDSTNELVATDFVETTDDACITVGRGELPTPNWSLRETDKISLVRTRCLRPMRMGTRTVPDAGYWLLTHLKEWAGDEAGVKQKLRLSSRYFARVWKWCARSGERKVSPQAIDLTEDQKASLVLVLEELVRRLYLVESGLPPGVELNLADWPGKHP